MSNLDAPMAFSITDTSVFDFAEALERVEGDIDLLKEMADLFLEECPNMLAEIAHAVSANDAQALQRAAHTLKGSVSNFAAHKATEASLALEKMGRQQDLTDAAAALALLEQELERLRPALAGMREKEAA